MSRKTLLLAAMALPLIVGAGMTSTTSRSLGNEQLGLIQRASTTTTDITTSNVYMDLKLLCNEGKDFSLFGSEKTAPSATNSMYKNFMFITGRPYQSDLYLYFFFMNSSSYDFKWNAQSDYYVTIDTGAGEAPTTPAFKSTKIEMVGTSKDSGNMHWVKYKATGVFSSVAILSKNYFSINSFGHLDGSDFVSDFDVKMISSFTYTDDKYDITASLSKPGCVVINDHKSFQWFVDNANVGGLYNVKDPNYIVRTNGSAQETDIGVFNIGSNLTIDKILGIELDYDYVTYYKKAVACNLTQSLGSDRGARVYRVPETQYSETDDIVASRKTINKWVSSSDTVNVTINNQLGIMPDFWKHEVTHTWKTLIDSSNYPSDIDTIEKETIEKSRGACRFAYIAEANTRMWDWDAPVEYANGWDKFWAANPIRRVICHEAMGQIISRVMFMSSGIIYSYNAWDQPVNPTWSYNTPVQTISAIDWLKYKASQDGINFWDKIKTALIIASAVAGTILVIYISLKLYQSLASKDHGEA